tara:strand:- start:1452 stop:1679 length:228 start_codon:yes stop_codon:yes gene_type:complete
MQVDSVLKWLATLTLIVGSGVNAMGVYPVGPLILIGGGILWLTVAVIWKEWSLIVTNALMVGVAIIGLLVAHRII